MGSIRLPERYPPAGDVAGKRVVVTGASRGLGRVVAGAFHAHGAKVVLVGRDAAALEQVAAELGDGRALACPGDVATAAGNDAAADRAVEAWGGLDVWIANAGISPSVERVTDLDPDGWQRVLDVNLTGVLHGARAAARVLGDGGRIIATGSVLGERTRPGFAAYAAAKAGVVALCRVLAAELAPREILVNVVCPGWFDSPLAEGWMANPTLERRILDHTLLERWGRSEEIAGPYLFLASDAAAFVTGSVLAVDGGYLVP